MIDLVKHAENIRKKLAGISGVTAPEFSANTYLGVQPAPVTPANVIAERYARPEPTPIAPQPYSLTQGAKSKSDIEYEAFNARTTRLAGDTRPLRPSDTAALAAKVASRTAASDAAYAAMSARTTTLTPNAPAQPNVLAMRSTIVNKMGPDGLPIPTFVPGNSTDRFAMQSNVTDNPALNVLERKQQLAQIGARR